MEGVIILLALIASVPASSIHFGWLAGVVLILLPFAARSLAIRRRQRRELLALARRRNLKFSPVDLIGLHDRYINLNLIRRGHGRHACNVLYGSTELGLVAAFRYSYDLGFGAHQTSISWWVVVLEGSRVFEAWFAQPVAGVGTDKLQPIFDCTSEPSCVGPFMVSAERADTLWKIQRNEILTTLRSMPPECHIEACGPLLAIAVPFDPDPVVLNRLLESVDVLASQLRAAGT